MLAFYMSFLMYEDEEGVWQNRLEELWIIIDEQKKAAEGTTTALFNRIGDILRKAFDHLFGTRLLSFRSFVITANFSFLTLSLFAFIDTINFVLVIRPTQFTHPRPISFEEPPNLSLSSWQQYSYLSFLGTGGY